MDRRAGPAQVWVVVPKGWRIRNHLYELPVMQSAISDEVRRIDFEVIPPQQAEPGTQLRCYALYYVCEGESGTCLYRRQDFEVALPVPQLGPQSGPPDDER